jgi:hypothetical protein
MGYIKVFALAEDDNNDAAIIIHQLFLTEVIEVNRYV